MTAYYNEVDPKAAAWLRELIKAGLIAPGEVDERSIEDITPVDLEPFTQCHFFAGIGGWSYALRLAGWPDDRPVWTGSCPCQPFSAAGKGGGFADERHLWPAWLHLIEVARPSVIFGEQVASALAWVDLVSSDLETAAYSVGAVDLCAPGVGAPHIRQRIYFVADSDKDRQPENARGGLQNQKHISQPCRGVDHAAGEQMGVPGRTRIARSAGLMGDADSARLARRGQEPISENGVESGRTAVATSFWNPADWIACQDGKQRPVEPGTFPLANGLPHRMGLLRGYGNAIVAPLAAEFIKAYCEVTA